MSTKKHAFYVSALTAASLLTAAMPASAAVIAFYPFNGTSLTTSIDTEPNSTAGGFTDAGGFFRSGSSNWVQTYASIASRTEAEATGANNDYSSFTVAPAPGFQLNLTDLTFSTQVNTTSGTLGGTFLIRSSRDSFASNVATFQQINSIATSAVNRVVTLTDPTFQGITSPLTFRLYVYKEVDSTVIGDGMRVDNVILNGAVVPAVPEPASLAMLGALAGGVLLRRGRGNGRKS